MAQSAFTLKYDGPALDEGVMPVSELAPALIALGNVFTEASRTLYPEHPPVALNIRANPEEGSFLVHLLLEGKDAWDYILTLTGSKTAGSLANLQAFVVEGGIGVFALIKWLKGRKIVSTDQENVKPGHVRIVTDDNQSIEVPTEVLQLFASRTLRKNAAGVVAPLTRNGIRDLAFKTPDNDGETIDESDVPSFVAAEEDEDVLWDEPQTMVVEIVSLSFTEGNKWRFSLGQTTISAAIEDQDFLTRIDSGEAFAKGDMLRCRMRVVQTRRQNKLHTEYHLLEVLDHLHPPDQLAIDDEGDGAE